MRKNGSRQLSIKQYKTTDLFLFALILVVSELCIFGGMRLFPNGAFFTFSFTVPIVCIVMMRWGWPSVLYGVLSGVTYCLLNKGNTAHYIIYGLGNAFVGLALIPLHFIKKQRVTKNGYIAAVFVLIVWLCVYLGRSSITAILVASGKFRSVLGTNATIGFSAGVNAMELLSLIIGILIVVGLRKFDGMVEDQKTYLIRLDKERREKLGRDAFGDEEIEFDQQTIDILRKNDEMFL